MNEFYYTSPYLSHHGIKGMRWGIRRYQNEDGSLTWAGKRRVKKAMRLRDDVLTSRDPRDKTREEKKLRKYMNKLTDSELDEIIKRSEKDEAIRKLTDVRKEEDKILKGMEYASKAVDLATSVSQFAGTAYTIGKTASALKNGDISGFTIGKSGVQTNIREKKRDSTEVITTDTTKKGITKITKTVSYASPASVSYGKAAAKSVVSGLGSTPTIALKGVPKSTKKRLKIGGRGWKAVKSIGESSDSIKFSSLVSDGFETSDKAEDILKKWV